MLSPTRGLPLDPLASNRSLSSLTRQSIPDSTDSFGQQLAGALEKYLGGVSSSGPLQIEIAPSDSPNSGARQFLVTVTTAPAIPAAAAEVSSAALGKTEADPPKPVFRDQADAYWAMQPEEVQALRSISDPLERGMLALELSQKGYKIDNEIMVLNWDPYMTMKVRKELGYTWFPSLGQSMTPVQPGLSFPGLPSYDPSNPPAGSITVSTDFAIGLEHTSVCGRPANAVTNSTPVPSLTAI